MKNSHWQKIVFISSSRQWLVGLSAITACILLSLKFFLLPPIERWSEERTRLTLLKVQVSDAVNQYRENKPITLLREQMIQFTEPHTTSLRERLLSMSASLTKWQQNEETQQVVLSLGWQPFLLLLNEIQQVSTTPYLKKIVLREQGNKIAIEITFSAGASA